MSEELTPEILTGLGIKVLDSVEVARADLARLVEFKQRAAAEASQGETQTSRWLGG